jgi:hypothetical protein
MAARNVELEEVNARLRLVAATVPEREKKLARLKPLTSRITEAGEKKAEVEAEKAEVEAEKAEVEAEKAEVEAEKAEVEAEKVIMVRALKRRIAQVEEENILLSRQAEEFRRQTNA